MEIDPSTYPSRAFIRFTAQNQLRATLTGESFTASVQRKGGEGYTQQVTPDSVADLEHETAEDSILDEALFAEIAQTAFNPKHSPELYLSCGTERSAQAVEARVAAELVETYLQIKLQQKCPIVRRLNTLL